MITREPSRWWPDHIRSVFATIGGAMRSERLYPEDLLNLSKDVGAIVPGHRVLVEHLPGKAAGRRKGKYLITIEGPLSGGWSFRSGELERLALGAVGSVQKS